VFAGYLDRAVHFMELPGDIPNRQVNARNLEAKFPCYLLFSKIFVYWLSFSELHFYIKQRRAVHFAWLSGAGIYHGGLNFGGQHR
jgi:vacuolar protein sorting-associated protein 18